MSTMFKVFVGNLSFKTSVDQIRQIFEPHVEVEDVVIATDPKTEKKLGYGFVMTRDATKGRQALRRIGKKYLDGRLVYFKEAHGKKGGRKPSTHRVRTRRPRPHQTRIRSGYVGLNRPQKPSED